MILIVEQQGWMRPAGATPKSYRFQCPHCGEICHQVTRIGCGYRFCPWCGKEVRRG